MRRLHIITVLKTDYLKKESKQLKPNLLHAKKAQTCEED